MSTELQLDGFLDDYFAECDEHLTEARRNLLALEGALRSPGTERQPLDNLFRIFHSIKGISGMVELREAEQLAHEMESYLRALRRRETLLTAEGVDTLIDGAQRLEQVVAARSREASIPSIADLERRLAALVPDLAAISAPAQETDNTPPAAFRVRFKPSRELADKGIGVDAVRRRLDQRTTIVETVPNIGDDGSIEFVFLVTAPSADALGDIRDMPIVIEAMSTPDPPAIEEAASDTGFQTIDRPSSSHFVRVDLLRLDELMQQVGDLVISRARLADSLETLEANVPAAAWRAVQDNAGAIDRQLRTLREGIMRVRLVPVGEIFGRMPLVVRDLARSFGRRVELVVAGQDTEIDKYLIERMVDPVLHLVRNSVAHGIERPEARVAVGKPAHGTIHLSAATAGDMVTIEVDDDGRGIDAEEVLRKARNAGLPVPAGEPSETTLLNLICAPGFSTRDESDRAAGRGVGMSVVKTAVEQLSGSLSLETRPGHGTRFTIQLPLTLAITDALIARVGAQTFAVPQGAVREVLAVECAAIRAVERREVMPYRNAALPLLRLDRLFGIDGAGGERLHVFVTGQGSAAVAFSVDRIVGQREIVVRPIADPLVRVEGVSGATDLGDGRVVLILDPAALARIARRLTSDALMARASAWRPQDSVRH